MSKHTNSKKMSCSPECEFTAEAKLAMAPHFVTEDVAATPTAQYKRWLNDWIIYSDEHPEIPAYHGFGGTLITINNQGFPRGRVVGIRGVDAEGLVFFTPPSSNKIQESQTQEKVGLHITWRYDGYTRQIEMQGTIDPWDGGISTLITFERTPQGEPYAPYIFTPIRALYTSIRFYGKSHSAANYVLHETIENGWRPKQCDAIIAAANGPQLKK